MATKASSRSRSKSTITPKARFKATPPTEAKPGLLPESEFATLDDWIDYVEHTLDQRGGLAAFLQRRRDHLARRIPFAPRTVAAYQAHYDILRDPDDMSLILATFLESAADDPALELQDYLENFVNEAGSNPRVDPLTWRPEEIVAPLTSESAPTNDRTGTRRRKANSFLTRPHDPRPGPTELPVVASEPDEAFLG